MKKNIELNIQNRNGKVVFLNFKNNFHSQDENILKVPIKKVIFEETDQIKYELDSLYAANDFIANKSQNIEQNFKISVIWKNGELYKGDYTITPIDHLKYKPLNMYLSNAVSKNERFIFEGVGPESGSFINLDVYNKFNCRLDNIVNVKADAQGIDNIYKKEFKKVIYQHYDVEECDKNAIKAILLRNEYNLSKIKECIVKNSPHVAILGKKYAEDIVKSLMTIDLKREIKTKLKDRER